MRDEVLTDVPPDKTSYQSKHCPGDASDVAKDSFRNAIHTFGLELTCKFDQPRKCSASSAP